MEMITFKIIEMPTGIFSAKAFDDQGKEIARSNIWKDHTTESEAMDDLEIELKNKYEKYLVESK